MAPACAELGPSQQRGEASVISYTFKYFSHQCHSHYLCVSTCPSIPALSPLAFSVGVSYLLSHYSTGIPGKWWCPPAMLRPSISVSAGSGRVCVTYGEWGGHLWETRGRRGGAGSGKDTGLPICPPWQQSSSICFFNLLLYWVNLK